MYFLRLADLKPSVEAAGLEAWEGAEVRPSKALFLKLCLIMGRLEASLFKEPTASLKSARANSVGLWAQFTWKCH